MKAIEKGFTLVELMLVIFLITTLTAVLILIFKPAEANSRARDEKRLSDAYSLDRAVAEYQLDKNAYPDSLGVLRVSTTLPTGATGPVQNSTSGWISSDLSVYLPKLPTDPLNNSTYFYSYKHDVSGYEIDVKLEYYANYSQTDGGNDAEIYEVGNNLTII